MSDLGMEESGRKQPWLVRKDPALTAEAVIAWCCADLMGYKVPGEVIFIEKLPRSGVGKVLRRELIKVYTIESMK